MIHDSWSKLFCRYEFVFDDENNDVVVYPPKELVFRVFEIDVRDINILLLGQDPYHGPNQAHGLSFSVNKEVPIPPSLKHIFKELNRTFLEREYNFVHGNLEKWFYNEKIFLLNCALTVIEGCPNSHMKTWKQFIDSTIKYICKHNNKCIFLLLGNSAKEKGKLIKDKSRIVEGTHPSPLAQGASQPFFGSGVFKQVEEKLQKQINWQN